MSPATSPAVVAVRVVASRVALGAVCAVIAVLAVAQPAAADVTVTPAEAVQGDAARLTFRVDDGAGPAYTTKVEVQLPEESPVAEVYPMSVDGWAPQMTNRTLDRPLQGLHGSGATTVTSAITWIRASGAPAKPGVAELSLSLGPLPQTDRLAFTVVQTMSDGAVRRWASTPAADGSPPAGPGPVLALRARAEAGDPGADAGAPAPGQVPPEGNGDEAPGAGSGTGDAAGQNPSGGNAPGYLIAGLIGAALVGLIGAAWFLAGRWLSPSDGNDARDDAGNDARDDAARRST